jgi:hypothetical protein
MEATPSQTEDAAERGFVRRDPGTGAPESYRFLGRGEQLEEESGDIADEGRGHRG